MALMKHHATSRFISGPALVPAVLENIAQALATHNLYEITRAKDRVSFALVPLLKRPFGRRRRDPMSCIKAGEIRVVGEGDQTRIDHKLRYHNVVIVGPLLFVFCFLGLFPTLIPEPQPMPMWGNFLMTGVTIAILFGYTVAGRHSVKNTVEEAIEQAGASNVELRPS